MQILDSKYTYNVIRYFMEFWNTSGMGKNDFKISIYCDFFSMTTASILCFFILVFWKSENLKKRKPLVYLLNWIYVLVIELSFPSMFEWGSCSPMMQELIFFYSWLFNEVCIHVTDFFVFSLEYWIKSQSIHTLSK